MSIFLDQFFRLIPIPPVTHTVVRKIGDIPLVPASTCAHENSIRKRDVWFESVENWLEVNVYDYETLQEETTLTGPSIIESKNTTIAIGPDGSFSKLKNGDIKVYVHQSDNEIQPLDFRDPVNLEIFLARLKYILGRMVLVRRSQVIPRNV